MKESLKEYFDLKDSQGTLVAKTSKEIQLFSNNEKASSYLKTV
jgi:hypothetical protein